MAKSYNMCEMQEAVSNQHGAFHHSRRYAKSIFETFFDILVFTKIQL
jgi:hypothetical protein